MSDMWYTVYAIALVGADVYAARKLFGRLGCSGQAHRQMERLELVGGWQRP